MFLEGVTNLLVKINMSNTVCIYFGGIYKTFETIKIPVIQKYILEKI